ncbi:MAG: pyridoxamine 5'-phosphate oxidase family protein [Caldilineaceae bacterium]
MRWNLKPELFGIQWETSAGSCRPLDPPVDKSFSPAEPPRRSHACHPGIPCGHSCANARSPTSPRQIAAGVPQVTPVWVDYDGEYVLINTAKGRKKDRNLRANPQVAISVLDPDNPYRLSRSPGRSRGGDQRGACLTTFINWRRNIGDGPTTRWAKAKSAPCTRSSDAGVDEGIEGVMRET